MFYSQKLQMKQLVADKFLDRFQLKPEEITVLRGTKSGSLTPVRKHLIPLPFKTLLKCLLENIITLLLLNVV